MNIFEITIQEEKNGSWPVETKLTRSYDLLPVHHKGELKLSEQDRKKLRTLKSQRQKYGQFLGGVLFQGEISEAYLQALDSSLDGMRVLLTVEDTELEVLYWHWLCAPREWNSISLNQRCCFSISLKSSTERSFPPINQDDLKALILAASPQGLDDYSLASFDVQETVNSLKTALGQIPTDVLAVDGGLGMPTLDQFCHYLTQTSYSFLHIVGHGQVNQQGETILYWATKENLVEPVTGTNLIQRLQNIQNLPHFIFLSACETAKSEAGMALGGLAQRIVRELGIPAVLAMTENVTIETAALLSKAFYPRLRKHGEVDKALVEATSSLSRHDILVPALFSRLGRNSLFDTNRNELSADKIRQRTLNKKSPYKGLKRFNFQDREYFFGRDALIYKLFTAVNQSSFSLVLGASGSGKSSVVRAGLIPELQEYIEIHKKFYYFIFTPNQDPFNSLYNCLINEEKDYNFSSSDASLALKAESVTLMEIINTLKKEDEYWLFFIDQFEQLFTVCTDLEKRKSFIEGIVEVAKKGESSVKIVLAMRSDFVEQFSFYPTLGAIANQNNIHLVTEMYPDELRRAIAQPAAKNGVVFEEGLIEQIIEEVEGQKGYLPLLQYTLDLLWEKECKTLGADGRLHIEDRTLNKINYAALEGVRGALQKRVDEIYKNICHKNLEGELVTKQIFLKLVNIVETDSGSQPVGRRAYRNEFVGEPIENILKRFIDENLLVSSYEYSSEENLLVGSRDDKYIEHATVEIAHEILLSSWEQLKRWLEEEKEVIILKNWLAGETRKWLEVRAKDELKASDELLKGSRLEQVVELRKKNGFEKLGGLVAEENEFIDVSIQAKDKAEKLAKRRQRQIIGGLTTGIVAISMVAGGLFWQLRRANINEINALSNSAEALLASNQELNALVTGLKTGKRIKNSFLGVDNNTKIKLIGGLQNIFYQLKEFNRLESHTASITSLVFSPDGKTIASASNDNTVKLWNLNGQLLHTLEGHTKKVLDRETIRQVVFSPDGKIIASFGDDNRVKLWNLNGEFLHALENHESYVGYVAFSPDGQTIASAGTRHSKIKLWNLNGQLLNTFEAEGPFVNSVVFSPDAKTIASASNKIVQLWNINGELIHTFEAEDFVNSVVFSPDAKTIASASNKTVQLWNINGELIHTFESHTRGVKGVSRVAFSPDAKTIASASNKTVQLWNINGELIHTFESHTEGLNSVAFSPDGKTIASSNYGKIVKLWNINGELIHTFEGHTEGVSRVAFSLDGKTIAFVGGDDTVELLNWNLNKQLLHTFEATRGGVNGLELSPNGKTIASASNDGMVKLWNLNGQLLHAFKAHTNYVNHVVFSPDGETIASASNDGMVKLWNLNGQLLHAFKAHTDYLRWLVFSPDGKTIATASRSWTNYHGSDGVIKLWNLNGQLLHTLKDHEDGVNSVVFSPDGKTIASGGGIVSLEGVIDLDSDDTVKLWNLNGQLLHTLKGHRNYVSHAVFSPDGKIIASASGDRTIKLWNLNGQLLHTLKGHKNYVNHVVFSPDGKTIASASDDKTVKLWNLNGQLLHTLKGSLDVVFSPDGQTIASNGGDNTVKLWNLEGQLLHIFKGPSEVVFSPDGKTIISINDDKTIKLWSLDLEEVMIRGCNWARGYLTNNPNISEEDRKICDGIDTK